MYWPQLVAILKVLISLFNSNIYGDVALVSFAKITEKVIW